MTKQLFNPFEDRLSRDIRNDLSEGLAEAVETGSSDKLTKIVKNYRQQPLADYYRDYLEDRYVRYEQALQAISVAITDPIQQALVLWNLELFFEVHEVLEHAWYSAEGNMKLTLQALIRAAGVYIKRKYGFNDSANRIAAKAIPVLEANQEILGAYFKTKKLTSALKSPEALPPKLSS
ncbi:MAG: DUF309 domain-containing protein [Desulfobulbaceae bacterium]|nr:DUF309 domain-containing protein [Desulfobulbaceae bacterium]